MPARSNSCGLITDIPPLYWGVTALLLAVELDHWAVVEALLRMGADASGLLSGGWPRRAPILYPLTCGLSPRTKEELLALAYTAVCAGSRPPAWSTNVWLSGSSLSMAWCGTF